MTEAAETPLLTDTPQGFSDAFTAHFNTFNLDIVMRIFEPDAVLHVRGETLAGDALRAAVADFLRPGTPIEVRQRFAVANGDTALVVADWTLSEMTGRTSDVIRRGRDGRWRHLIDNPFGTATDS